MSSYTAHMYSDLVSGMNVSGAAALTNQALALSRQGDYAGAERLNRQSLDIKLANVGPDAIQTALSWNALGESQLRQDKLAEAEESFKEAIRIREAAKGQGFDAAVSRDNLAQVYEARGMLLEARNTRSKFPRQMTCSNYKCPGQLFTMQDLKQCARCVSAYYCSKSCQQQDWKNRHKRYCVPYHQQTQPEEDPSNAN